ncbi:MAG: universal stress protein [Burkholderiaceae bacterium]
MFKKILVPTDGSELSSKAVTGAIALAKLHGAELVAMNVQPPFRVPPIAEMPSAQFFSEDKYEETIRAYAAEILGEVETQAKAAGVACDIATAVYDQPWQAIIDMAERKGCDLIFMSSHGRRGVAGLLLGSETQKVLTHCKVPVLVYR